MPDHVLIPVRGVIRDYAWGSHEFIQRLLDRAPDGEPAAELWFGDHPGDPSPAGDSSLDRLFAADPRRLLGDAGDHLPFLLKVLAADRALSIQVHPTRAQAQEGYDAEERAGIAVDARDRNYRDRNHKPELLCALTPFEALCGFRPVAESLATITELALPELDFLLAALRGEQEPLRSAVHALLTHGEPALLADAVASRASADGPLRASHLTATDYPGDIGVVVALLLNHVLLEPGQAIFLGAGNVHAYLRGAGVEIMASSDNVLRCALTGKHVDVPELMRIADFAELADPVLAPVALDDGVVSYPVPVPDFALRAVDLELGALPVTITDSGPQLVLCTSGEADVTALDEQVGLMPGQAAFVAAGTPEVSVAGIGQVFVASTRIGR